MATLISRFAVLVAVLAATVAAPPAHAAEDPGVYDITTNRTAYPAAGSMTVTWRAVLPANGSTSTGEATCHLSIGGSERTQVPCTSGTPFSYDLGTVTGSSPLDLEVDQFYADPNEHTFLYAITGTKTVTVDGMAPTAGIPWFKTFDGGDYAPDPMEPATPYQAQLVWHDNLDVQTYSCSIRRTSPLPVATVSPASCGSIPGSHGATAIFSTPSSTGSYEFVLEVADPAGNTATASRPFTVDATPPAVSFTSGPGDGISTSAASPQWAWTSDDPGATYTCWAGTAGATVTLVGCLPPYSAPGLPEGPAQLVVRATDGYGNNATTTVSFTIDRTKPTVVFTAPTDPAPVGPGTVPVAVQASEPATYLCSSAPDIASPVYAACGSATPGTTYSGSVSVPEPGIYTYGVKAVDAAGNVSDPAIVTVTVQPPVAGSAKVSGTPRVGSKLTASGTWTAGATRTYQWRRDTVDIAGATASTYTPTAKDLGHHLSVRVRGTADDHVPTTITSASVTVSKGVLTSGKARISGTSKVGRTLVASASPWTAGTTVRYQWFANGKKITGATHSKLKLPKKLVGKKLKVTITGSRVGYATRVVSVTRAGTVKR